MVAIAPAQFVISDLQTWGWVLIAIAVVQLVGAAALFLDFGIGRWIGILSATANAIAQLLSIQSYPLLSLALFSVDIIIIIYGLATHPSRRGGVF
jgi:hypothetical protein